MQTILEFAIATGSQGFLELACKALLLGLAATLLFLLSGRLAAATRHWILVGSAASLLVLPLAVSLLPEYALPLPAELPTILQSLPAAGGVTAALPASVLRPDGTAADGGGTLRTAESRNGPALRSLLKPALALVWLLPALILLVRTLIGCGVARRSLRTARRLETTPWNERIEQASRRLGLRRPVELYASERARMPMAVGILRPAVVLPAVALQWPESHLQVVLLHELAHIRRLDLASRLLSRIVLAIYWFNPLVWWHDRLLRRESEQACDDEVLRAGTLPSRYARHLLVLVRAAGASDDVVRFAAAFGQSPLDARIRSILDPRRKRRMPTLQKWAVTGLIALVLLGVACLGFAASPALASPATALQETPRPAPPPAPQPPEAPPPSEAPPAPPAPPSEPAPAPAPPDEPAPSPAPPPAGPPPAPAQPEPPAQPPPPPRNGEAGTAKRREFRVQAERQRNELERMQRELRERQRAQVRQLREATKRQQRQQSELRALQEDQRRALEERRARIERQTDAARRVREEGARHNQSVSDLKEEIARLKAEIEKLQSALAEHQPN